MTANTLHITVEPTAAFFDAALADVRQLEQNTDVDDRYVLSLPNEDALERVLRANNLELIRTIAADEPESLRELARQVDRDIKNVSTAVARLEELGLVKLVETGRAKQPTVWYDRLAIDVPLTAAGTDGTDVVPA